MVRLEASVVINRPVEDVFAYLADVSNQPQYDSGLVEIRGGPLRVGATVTQVRRFLGRRIEATSECTAYELNQKMAFKWESPFPGRAAVTFEPAGDGTRLEQAWEMEPGGFFKLAEPILQRITKREIEQILGTVKDLLEAETLVTAGAR